jgi:hypothetical protein
MAMVDCYNMYNHPQAAREDATHRFWDSLTCTGQHLR